MRTRGEELIGSALSALMATLFAVVVTLALRLRRPRKLRRIRVDPRAIRMHDRPLMDADSADLRG